MEQEESRDKVELLRAVGIHGAVSAVGSDGFFAGLAWDCAEG